MNSTVLRPEGLMAEGSRGRAIVDALRSLTRQEVAFFLLIALVIAAVNGVRGLEMMEKPNGGAHLLAGVLMPFLIAPFIGAGWLLADRAEPGRWPRAWRLAIALATSVTAAVIVAPLLLTAVGMLPPAEIKLGRNETTIILPAWVRVVSLWLDVALHTSLAFAVLEFRRRREGSQQVLQAALSEQAQLSRRLLESRLAAMQAQVEPQFLFDSLVDVQATYARSSSAGDQVMDRLINYLRVALPRLREQGSTVQAEAELLAAYLGVVAARHDGMPKLQFVVATDAAGARFYPMLLLPLVQRAIRRAQQDGHLPSLVELVVKRHGNEIGVLLRIDAGGLCADDPELARVRERLAGLYAARAELTCHEPQPGCSEFVLRVPPTAAIAS
jgi:hypothetical protein